MEFYCKKDFKMSNGRIEFTAGKVYEGEKLEHSIGARFINDSGFSHTISGEYFTEHFTAEIPKKLPEFVEKLLKEEKEYLVGKLNNLQAKAEMHRASLDTTQKDIDATIEKLKQVEEVLS